MKTHGSNARDKFKGCLIGLACGDYLGMPFEYKTPIRVKRYFESNTLQPINDGNYTDDTAQAICLAESLIEKGFNTQDQFKRFKQWMFEGYATADGRNATGVGQHTQRILSTQTEENLPTELVNDDKAGGNGALMRCAPMALFCYQNPASLKEQTIASTIITHNNNISAWSCVILNTCVLLAIEGKPKESFMTLMENNLNSTPPELQTAIKLDYTNLDINALQTSGYSLHTLLIALTAFFSTDSYEECITKAISVGGDTDTQGAVSGALAGAYYGYDSIPDLWKTTLKRREYIEQLATKLFEINSR